MRIPLLRKNNFDINLNLILKKRNNKLFNINIPNCYFRFNFFNLLKNKNIIYKEKLTKLQFDEIKDNLEIKDYIKIKISNIEQHLNYLLKLFDNNNSCEVKLLEHDLRFIFIKFHKKNNINKLDFEYKKDLLIQELNLILKDIIWIFRGYILLDKETHDEDFWIMWEHLSFNNLFNYLKKNKIQINNYYLNEFNSPKEIKIKENRFIKEYFPESKEKLMISNVGLYSVSKPESSELIIEQILKIVSFKKMTAKKLTITDGTSGVGGDVIQFGKIFRKVNAVEISKVHSEIIEHNIKQYSLDNVNVLNSDYTKIYDKIKQDIIFLDSPWGGTDYVKTQKANLVLFGTDLTFNNFIKNLLLKNNDIIICIKCPVNFSIVDLGEIIFNSKENMFRHKKMKVIGITNFLLIIFY